jgi:hypothetical protein
MDGQPCSGGNFWRLVAESSDLGDVGLYMIDLKWVPGYKLTDN